jgi:hypothetical protein
MSTFNTNTNLKQEINRDLCFVLEEEARNVFRT